MNDDQVRLYSRQILLRSVGGEGQQQLLNARIFLEGSGEALSVAGTYLEAGGCQVWGPHSGLAGWADLSTEAVPGAEESCPWVMATVSEGSFPLQTAPTWIAAFGVRDGGAEFWMSSADGCRACLSASFEGIQNPVPVDLAVTVGTLAALCVQRAIWGWEGQRLTGFRVDAEGIKPLLPKRCFFHSSSQS